MTETLHQYSLKCDCGFEGAVRVNFLPKCLMSTIQCIGCDQIYKFEVNELLNRIMPVKLTEVPTFNSWDQMQEFLDKHNKKVQTPTGGEETKSSRKSNKTSKSTKGRSTRIKSAIPAKETDDSVQELFYVAIHFYTRKGDSFTQVMKDAKEESSVRGEGSVVYAHSHYRGVECNEDCKEYNAN